MIILWQIFSVAVLLYTPLVCSRPIAVPILAAYSGVLTRFTISLIAFYRLVFPKLSKTTVVSNTSSMYKTVVYSHLICLLSLLLVLCPNAHYLLTKPSFKFFKFSKWTLECTGIYY